MSEGLELVGVEVGEEGVLLSRPNGKCLSCPLHPLPSFLPPARPSPRPQHKKTLREVCINNKGHMTAASSSQRQTEVLARPDQTTPPLLASFHCVSSLLSSSLHLPRCGPQPDDLKISYAVFVSYTSLLHPHDALYSLYVPRTQDEECE